MALEDRIGDAFGFSFVDDKKSTKKISLKNEKQKKENKSKDTPKGNA